MFGYTVEHTDVNSGCFLTTRQWRVKFKWKRIQRFKMNWNTKEQETHKECFTLLKVVMLKIVYTGFRNRVAGKTALYQKIEKILHLSTHEIHLQFK